VGGVALAVEGRHFGFEASIDAVGVDAQTLGATTGSIGMGWGTLHVTWSPVSERNVRVRLELGGSMLSLSDTGAAATEPWAGNVIFGPSIGISGQLGLVGPLGLEGHARLSPRPVPVADSRLAAAFRAGPLALTLGYRSISVQGGGKDAPEVRFSGPELGLAFRF
jgi:hypothetical protein